MADKTVDGTGTDPKGVDPKDHTTDPRLDSLTGIVEDATRGLDGIAASLRFVAAQLSQITGKTPDEVLTLIEPLPASKRSDQAILEALDILTKNTEHLRATLVSRRFHEFARHRL